MADIEKIEQAIEVTQRQVNELKELLLLLETEEYIDAYKLAIDVKELSIEALQEKLERIENKPLTLEELKKMDGEPVYVIGQGEFGKLFWI